MLGKLRRFNNGLDDWLIEMAMPLLVVGFIMATTDWLLHGRMATQGWFEDPWALAQSISIDGAFFGIWLRIFKTKWLWKDWHKLLAMLVAGLIMGFVAMLVNGILTYQQVYNIADSFLAMQALHIDLATLVYIRAPLVVFVAILIIPIRKKAEPLDSHMATTSIAKRPRQRATVHVKELPKEPPKELPETVTATTASTEELRDSHIDTWSGGAVKEQCIAKWLASDQGHGVKKAIALELGIGYSTVKKYIAESEKAHV